ncbi:hypothetical protein [Nocardia bovistercoris]|uniref:Uncharacterized protein n=1 Tax=Nocardia bovistercoris TaxID=2785916 RepID=A0A931II65_9NOCA|nr:hypothetical protein [Nocardia bovistercoris]MBH0781889.1 hypothetical protein [Nocardia bovistercoris]
MRVDRGLIPISIDVDSQWSRTARPHEYETEFLKAYDLASLQEYQQILSTRRLLPDGGFDLDCGAPDRRTQLSVLLETSGWSEYQYKLETMIANPGYGVSSRIMHGSGPAVSMTADRSRVTSIAVAATWTEAVNPPTIVEEILGCADQIRALRPRFTVWGDYSRYSLQDLEFQHDRHVKFLQEQASYIV